jgi:multisubunit Na+/H+ antiporter MnhC subunit
VPPHPGPTAAAALVEAAAGTCVPLSEIAPWVSPELRAIVERAMAPAPQDRYPRAADFAEALDRFRDRAVVQSPPLFVGVIAQVLPGVTTLLLLVGSIAVWGLVPSIRDQGFFGYFFVALTGLGCALSAVEWWTAGRYRIAPVTMAMALCTVVVGFAATSSGVSMLLQSLATPETPLVGDAFRDALVSGLNIAVSTIATSSMLAALQFMLWGMARRATLLASDKSRRGT